MNLCLIMHRLRLTHSLLTRVRLHRHTVTNAEKRSVCKPLRVGSATHGRSARQATAEMMHN